MPAGSPGNTLRKTGRALRWAGAVPVLLLLAFFAAVQLAEGPLRAYLEKRMNQALTGYAVTLPELDLHFPTLALTLHDLTVRQEAHPEPAVARFPRLQASVHWYEVLFGRLVAEFELDDPQIHVNLIHLLEEDEDEVPVEERGWQEAAQAIYPLKVNRLEVTGGEITYLDQDPDRPLTLSGLSLLANNIRNIHSPESVYPSPLHLESTIFGSGRVVLDGRADFLAAPHPGFNARIELQSVPLSDLKPVADRSNLFLSGGELTRAAGHLEYAPQIKTATLETLQIRDLKLDYVRSPQAAAMEEKRIEQVRRAAAQVEQQENLQLQAQEVRITDSELGFVNQYADPPYRLFLSRAQIVLSNFSDDLRQGPARARIAGRFLGSGAAAAALVLRPAREGSDFDLDLKIVDTRLRAMNDLLRAYGNFDVAGGRFSLFSEVQVRGQAISGYLKPLFQEMDIYDPAQEEDEGLLKKAYEGLLAGLAELLENPQEEIAARVDLAGTVEDPETSTLQIILQLIKNGFFESVLPGFEQAVGQAGAEKKEPE